MLLIGTNDLTALEKAAAGTAALQQKLVWAAPEVARRWGAPLSGKAASVS